MAREPFKFTLQVQRIEVESDRDELVSRVRTQQRELKAARQVMQEIRGAIEETVQQIGALRDEEVRAAGTPVSADDGRIRAQHLEHLREREVEKRAAAVDQDREVRGHVMRLRELDDALNEKEAELKRLDEKEQDQLRAWRRENEKNAEKKRDEEAQLRWLHEKRRREEGPPT